MVLVDASCRRFGVTRSQWMRDAAAASYDQRVRPWNRWETWKRQNKHKRWMCTVPLYIKPPLLLEIDRRARAAATSRSRWWAWAAVRRLRRERDLFRARAADG